MIAQIKVLFLLFFISFLSTAQETGSIEGKIISKDGFPLSGVTIKLGKKITSSKTDANGLFHFDNFPIGIHTITIDAEGLKRQSQEIKVVANEITRVSFTLEEEMQTLKEIVIVIKESPNKKKETVLSGLNIKPMDLPQSIQIVSQAVITQQQTIRLSEVVKNVNGVYVGSARGGAQESFWSRGYDMTANNMLKNGFRQNGGSMPEVATLEKVEVLKGSAALLFGNVTPGGILNMVTKTPSFTKGGEINFQAGSYSFYKPTLDFYGPLSKKIAYRFVGTYENSGSFRNNVTRDRVYLNPSFLYKVTPKTDIIIQGDYLKDNWTPDFGTGVIGQIVANVPRATYLGALWSNGQTKQTSLSGIIKHQLNSDWKLSFNSSFQNYDRISIGTERILPLANGDWTRPLGQNKATEQIIGSQINIQGTFTTGKIKHQVFSGIDSENALAQAYTFVFNPANYDIINIFDASKFLTRTDIPTATTTKIVKTTTNRFGVYAQDLLSVTKQFKVLAGIRWSWQEAVADTYNFSPQNSIVKGEAIQNKAFSPKLGLVYQPNPNTSLFSSYSNSFIPNTGVTITNEPLKPSLIDQYEIGIKKDFWKGILSTNLTLYQINNSNLAQTAEFKSDGTINTDTNVKTLNGATTSKGIEIDIQAKPAEGITIMTGYSYNDMRYTKTSGAIGSYIEGDRLVRTPAHTANFSFFYTIPFGKLKGLSLGSMMNYTGERLGGYNNTIGQTIPDRTIPLNGYTTIDVSTGYTWKKWSILCKLSNITNELSYTVHENYSVNPIAPRHILSSLKYKF
jgi:iron complex outermembrane recepter protein